MMVRCTIKDLTNTPSNKTHSMQFLTLPQTIQFVDRRHCKLRSLGEYSRGWWIDRWLAWLRVYVWRLLYLVVWIWMAEIDDGMKIIVKGKDIKLCRSWYLDDKRSQYTFQSQTTFNTILDHECIFVVIGRRRRQSQ